MKGKLTGARGARDCMTDAAFCCFGPIGAEPPLVRSNPTAWFDELVTISFFGDALMKLLTPI
jgi:hypothetical protein